MISDVVYGEAIVIAAASGEASCYQWMTELGISYSQAVDVMDRMEREGIVGKVVSAGEPRKLL